MTTPEAGPYGFVRQTREQEAEFIAHMLTDITDEEVQTSLAAAKAVWEKDKGRPDYCNNVTLAAGYTKIKEEIALEIYCTAPHTDPTKPPRRIKSEGWISPPFRDGKFSNLRMYGNYENSKFPAMTLDKSKTSLSIELRADESCLLPEFVEDLNKWADALMHFQFETYFGLLELTDESIPDVTARRTKESLKSACTREAADGQLKQAQVVVRNGQDADAKYRHIPVNSTVAQKEILNTLSKRSKTGADVAQSRKAAIERVNKSWTNALADPWFYGMTDAAGDRTSNSCVLMNEFHEKCVEKIDSTRDTAIACSHGYVPVIGPNKLELSAASREAIDLNGGANLFVIEFQTPAKVLETNIGIYPRTIYWLGRITSPETGPKDQRRTDIV